MEYGVPASAVGPERSKSAPSLISSFGAVASVRSGPSFSSSPVQPVAASARQSATASDRVRRIAYSQVRRSVIGAAPASSAVTTCTSTSKRNPERIVSWTSVAR